MEPFRYHVYACEQRKPEGQPACSVRGGPEVIAALRRELGKKKLLDVVQVTTCGSLGLCGNGPNLVVYPEGVWYSGVSPADVPELVASHFEQGQPLERLVKRDEAALRAEVTENRNRAMAGMTAADKSGQPPEEFQATLRGYMPSRIILSALEIDLFTLVDRAEKNATAEPPMAATIARAAATDERATEMVLDALVALNLLTKSAGRYGTGPLAQRYLVEGAPDDSRLALRHNVSLWSTWSGLTEVLRTGNPTPRPSMDDRGDAWTAPFIGAMHKIASQRVPLVMAGLGLEKVQRMLDVGGGSGAYAIAFAKANPNLQAEVLDLASVLPITQEHIRAAGLADRVSTRVGDLQQDELGNGYDLVLLSAICHMLGRAQVRELLQRAHRALLPGGRVVIQDNIMSEDRTSPLSGALFAINMLVGTAQGGTYSREEYTGWLREAGFEEVQLLPLPGPTDLVVGQKVP